MLSYSANKQGNQLVNINKIVAQMTDTATANEFAINAQANWFYFAEGANKALYEAIKETDGGAIVKRNDDISIIDAFSQAIASNLYTCTIYAPPQPTGQSLNESQTQEVQQKVIEKLILPEIIQPVVVQSNEQLKPTFAAFTEDPQFEEVATYAETWVWQNIAMPVIAKGVKVYNDNIPENEVRPREYVVMSIDDEMQDNGFADNRNYGEQSFISLIIQGHGNTFENWVVEISRYIQELLREFRAKGKVHSITNRNIGMDTTANLLSRTISFWLINYL